jgi:hypothetical protein
VLAGRAGAPAHGAEDRGIAVVVEDRAHHPLGGRAEGQLPHRRVDRRDRELLRQVGRARPARPAGARAQALVVVDALGAHALGDHRDLLDREAVVGELPEARLGELDVELPQAQPAAEVLVGRGVRLVADRLGAPARGEDAELGELGERGVDGAAPELRHDRRRAGVDLVGRQVLGGPVRERAEDRAPLRRHPQPARPHQLRGVASGSHPLMFAHPSAWLVPADKTMSYVGGAS